MSVHPPALAWRLGLLAILWLIFCGGDLGSWPFGLPAILLATGLHLKLAGGQSPRLRPLILARFVPFFVVRSLVSGIDVMVRVFHPRLPIDPALVEYPLSIDHDSGRILLANCITLLPGTISARLSQDAIVVHTLDKGLPIVATIYDLEERIKKLYGPTPCQGGTLR